MAKMKSHPKILICDNVLGDHLKNICLAQAAGGCKKGTNIGGCFQ
jgi:hypothetical protein